MAPTGRQQRQPKQQDQTQRVRFAFSRQGLPFRPKILAACQFEFPFDWHWNELGNRIVAEQAWTWLQANNGAMLKAAMLKTAMQKKGDKPPRRTALGYGKALHQAQPR